MPRYSIVGMSHLKTENLVAEMDEGEPVALVREPDNPFDPNAVAVWARNVKVGYVPKATNAVLAGFIDRSGAGPIMGLDSAHTKFIHAKFVRSPNSRYPQVET
jgi:hypothetical protein